MNIEKIEVQLDDYPPKRSQCKRVTVHMTREHKRFIEDEAHRMRTTEFLVLYHLIDRAIERSCHESL